MYLETKGVKFSSLLSLFLMDDKTYTLCWIWMIIRFSIANALIPQIGTKCPKKSEASETVWIYYFGSKLFNNIFLGSFEH